MLFGTMKLFAQWFWRSFVRDAYYVVEEFALCGTNDVGRHDELNGSKVYTLLRTAVLGLAA